MTPAMTPLLITGRRFIAWLISLIAAPAIVGTDRPTLIHHCFHPTVPSTAARGAGCPA